VEVAEVPQPQELAQEALGDLVQLLALPFLVQAVAAAVVEMAPITLEEWVVVVVEVLIRIIQEERLRVQQTLAAAVVVLITQAAVERQAAQVLLLFATQITFRSQHPQLVPLQ
jgi:hypothetical protein